MTHPADMVAIPALSHTSTEEFKLLAVARNFLSHSKIVDWLKSEFEVEPGHATMISHVILPDALECNRQNKLFKEQFKGSKADWLSAFHELSAKLNKFGKDLEFVPTNDSVLIKRADKMFGLIKVTDRQMTIGLNLPGVDFTDKFKSAKPWTDSVTHSIEISLQQQINDEVISWLKAAYAKAL